MLTSSAVTNPFTLNPGTSHEVRSIIRAFITKIKSPKVKTVIGNVRKTRTGFTIELRIPKTIATITIVGTLAT